MSRPILPILLLAALAISTSGVCFSAGSLLQQVPPKSSERRNPFADDPSARLAGAKLYRRECAFCHGAAGQGIGHAPPLVSSRLSRFSPGAIAWVLKNGSVFSGMPSFSHLPEAQRWQIVTFLLSGGPAPREK